MSTQPTRNHRAFGMPTWASVLVMLAGIGWALYLLRGSWREFSLLLPAIRPGWLALGLTAGVAATFTGFLSFRCIIAAMLGTPMPLSRHGHLFFTSQILKHVPGRIAGVAYQIGNTRRSTPAAPWIAANLMHTALTLYTAVIVSASLLFATRPWLMFLMLAVGTAIWLAGSLCGLPHRINSLLPLHEGRIWNALRRLAQLTAEIPHSAHLKIFGWMILSWALYTLAWVAYGLAHPALGAEGGVHFCALYNLAWLAGYLSLVTPSGLGVREAVFASLALNADPASIAYGMLVGRFSLLLIDSILAIIFSPFSRSHDANPQRPTADP